MKIKQLIITAMMALLALPAMSQQKKWNFEFGAGASDNSGNVDNFSLKNNAGVYFEDSTMCFATRYKFIYQLENGRESNKGVNGSLNFDFYKFGEWSTFVAMELTSNHYKGYDIKTSELIGAKYNFLYKTDTCEYSLSGAFVYDNVNYTDEDTYLNRERVRISIRPKIKQCLGDNLMLTFVTFYQPSIKDFDDYIFNTSFHLETKMTKRIFLDLNYNYEYRSEIPSDKYRHYDSSTELTLKLKF